ncbi:hypothetical protein ERJ75_001000600 [Trypanosoma vivax]|uniref:Uncharacterized protein n=1 Tax=Trypanosoma vivax (strain Y486) TaxID=1055687 RepID=G0UAW3_TRYVY|nr:hypothetical protein TRVL_00975 [Trypanosoma vivax]KAH8611307.1 hypothetical protein ERJ75_001000600 [Trypanosoma vivax]CCC52950.1 conserved hypothetical protein [Trypanosoma vivax Y486]
MFHRLSIMFYKLDPRDYPEYMRCQRSTEQPGTVLMESRAMQGIRYTVPIGYLLSILYFYCYHRPRLCFADRELAKLHHYFYPSAGYSTPIGIVAGVIYACYYDGYRDCSDQSALRAIEQERARAMEAWGQYEERRKERGKSERWGALYALLPSVFAFGDSKSSQVAAGLPEKSYEDFIEPYGILSVGQQTAAPHDPSFYEHYSKHQVDALVSRAMKLRKSSEEERWLHTAGRLGSYGIVGMLLTWNSGRMFFRLFMGLGLGVVCAGVISGTKMDT